MLYGFSRDSTDGGCRDPAGAGLLRATAAERGQENTGLTKHKQG